MEYIFTALAAYVLGSVPSGLLIGRIFWQTDLREHGSCNIGATNAFRTLGRTAALLIFTADALKGVAGVWLGSYFTIEPSAMVLGGIMAIIGHNWSIFLGFKGGKGVATGLGVIAMLMPTVTFIVFVLWVVVVYLTRYVSLASVLAATAVPILAYIEALPADHLLFALVAAVFVVYRHKSNIERLLNGTESKIKASGR